MPRPMHVALGDGAAPIRDAKRGGDRRVPIIALTAHAFAGEQERVRQVGMDDFLSKPV